MIIDTVGMMTTSITPEITDTLVLGSTVVQGIVTTEMIRRKTRAGRERKMTSFRWEVGTITRGSSAGISIKTIRIKLLRIGITTTKASVNSRV